MGAKIGPKKLLGAALGGSKRPLGGILRGPRGLLEGSWGVSGGFMGFIRQPSCRGANSVPPFWSQETPLDPPKMGRNRPPGPPGGLWSPSQGLFGRVRAPKCANLKSWRFAQAKFLFCSSRGAKMGPRCLKKYPRGLQEASWGAS